MTSIQMPQLGETIIEGTILKWLKQEGDTIERDEPLFEISTDKVDTEVPSPVAGTVTKILVPEGETVAVGTELAEIDSGDGAAASPATPAAAAEDSAEDPAAEVSAISTEEPVPTPLAARPAAQAPAAAAATTAPAMQDRGPRSQILSPLVRKLAAEHSLDLAAIAGTGTSGARRDGGFDVVFGDAATGACAGDRSEVEVVFGGELADQWREELGAGAPVLHRRGRRCFGGCRGLRRGPSG